jgi:ATP-dependent exoDNAse (exonuclease V) beta subunit
LLPLCAAQLRLIFSQQSQVDYIENAQSALCALGDAENPTDISLSLDHKIQHLLVDEFQDTSSNQFQLLEKLTAGWMPDDGRTLFLVGDPMQSIYRFRQAEVGLFLHAKHVGIGQIRLTFISLSSNFRSSAQIVNWTNDNFQSIFPEQENIRLGAIPYSAAHAIHVAQANSQTQCVYFNKQEKLAEENYIIETILSIKKSAPEESIAILIRSRDHLKSITPLLQAACIEYQAVDIETLSHEPIIHDLLSLTRACIHLGDRVAWLACLRAPWCGLTLQDLWILAHAAKEKTVWEILFDENILMALNDDAQQRILHFRQAMTFAIQQRQRVSLRDIVEKTWRRLGGQQFLSDDSQQPDMTQFFEVLEKIINSAGVIQPDILQRKIEKLFAATAPSLVNPVQIMTIHKAKGLEFHHVFLPKLHKKTAPLDRPLITWCEYPDDDNIHHLLLAPMSEINTSDKTYDYIQQQQQKKLLLEMDRLLYVATTRAKKCLFLTATLEVDETEKVIPPKNDSLLGRIWRSRPQLFKAYVSAQEKKSLELKPAAEYLFHRVTLSTIQALPKKQHQPYTAEQKNAPELTLAEHRQEAKIGEIIHLLIERIAENGITWWQALRTTQQQKIIHALQLQSNLIVTSSKIHRAIENLIHDPRGQWILKKRDFAFSEYVIYFKATHQWQKSIIDRVFQDDDGQYWIIDFKSSENLDPTLPNEIFIQQAAKRHAQQLQSYQQALSQALNIKNIQCALYFPLLPVWMVYSI